MRIFDTALSEINLIEEEFPWGAYYNLSDRVILDFFHELSRLILCEKGTRGFSDLLTFAFFCRRSSLKRELSRLGDLSQRIGRGTTLHIAPNNIPMNFAYSFVMGLLSGNSNIVKLPNRTDAQIQLFLDIYSRLATKPRYMEIFCKNIFLRGADHESIEAMVKRADSILVWGDDETVRAVARYNRKASCVTINFPNRVSSLILNSRTLLGLNKTALANFMKKFYNDTYLMDCNACSSPSFVFFVGDAGICQAAEIIFWRELSRYVDSKYKPTAVVQSSRLINLMKLVNKIGNPIAIEKHGGSVWEFKDDAPSTEVPKFGVFQSFVEKNLTSAITKFRENEQTCSYFGFKRDEILNALIATGKWVDRIVPTGRALEMTTFWDGMDLLDRLSRKVDMS